MITCEECGMRCHDEWDSNCGVSGKPISLGDPCECPVSRLSALEEQLGAYGGFIEGISELIEILKQHKSILSGDLLKKITSIEIDLEEIKKRHE